MMRIEETQLPGVGVRHDFVTRSGARVGVINHRSGRRELLVYAESDPDACSEVLRLDEDEGHALADLLGGTTVTEHIHDIKQQVEGLTIDWLRVTPGSPLVGRTLADLRIRQETGVSVVAVQRGRDTVPSPAGDFQFEPADTAVVVGTPEGIEKLSALLLGG